MKFSLLIFAIGLHLLSSASAAELAASTEAVSAIISSQLSIVNGTRATRKDVQLSGLANSVVYVRVFADHKTHYELCTGTLISPRIVVTAGHCFVTDEFNHIDDMEITFQSLHEAQGKTIAGERFMVHPRFLNDEFAADDLALVLLSEDAPATVRPVELPVANVDIKKLNSFRIAGYGDTADPRDFEAPTGDLRYADLTSAEISDGGGLPIWEPFPGFLKKKIGGHMITFYNGRSSTCEGDSGGPLFYRNPETGREVLIGSTELNMPLADPSTEHSFCHGYSFFVNIATHLKWIASASAELALKK